MDLGAALLLDQRPKEARPHLLAAIKINPEYHQAHLNLGDLLAEEGSASGARNHFCKVVESGNPQIRGAAQQALEELAGTNQN